MFLFELFFILYSRKVILETILFSDDTRKNCLFYYWEGYFYGLLMMRPGNPWFLGFFIKEDALVGLVRVSMKIFYCFLIKTIEKEYIENLYNDSKAMKTGGNKKK